ncbi:MAG TPA: glycogen/starch synthase [Pyrinomonadaceae bacterium]|nr:glycogen/starch synthase [Pyrinomonadaceae bacterium]
MKTRVLLASQQIRGVDGTGGLGDVPVGLAKELLFRGDADIRLIMPGFSIISGEKDHPELKDRFNLKNLVLHGLKVPFGGSTESVDVYRIKVPKTEIECYLLRCSGFDELNKEADLYATDSRGVPNKNTAPRAILFSRAVVEFLRQYKDFRVGVVHCNDWNTALIPVYLQTIYSDDPYLGRIATLYTTHNAGGEAYQGGFPLYGEYRLRRGSESLLILAGLEAHDVFQGGVTRSLHHKDRFNFTKGAFGFADILNTVSHKYRKELLTSAFADGLDEVLSVRNVDFAGIVNGIDVEEWDPATDKYLDGVQYSTNDASSIVREKKNGLRAALRNWQVPKDSGRYKKGDQPFLKLRDSSILLGVVSRIDYQKAPILLGRIQNIGESPIPPAPEEELEWRNRNGVINPIEEMLARNHDVQIVILGNANDLYGSRFVNLLHELRQQLFEQVLFFEGFDIPLSHLIFAVSEIFLQPSLFEPAGLTQQYAMRYGALPVVRAVGGLDDTVVDNSDANRVDEATGFKFLEEDIPSTHMVNEKTAPAAFVTAVERSLRVFRSDPARWNQLMANAMKRDASWAVPAQQYLRLYDEALRRNLGKAFFTRPLAA